MGEPRVPPRLRRERTEVRVIRVDVDHHAPIPDHAYEASLVDVVYDAAVTRTEAGGAVAIGHELDPRSDRNTRFDAGCKKTCAVGVHDGVIGFDPQELDPLSQELFGRKERPGTRRSAMRRRTAPKSTA